MYVHWDHLSIPSPGPSGFKAVLESVPHPVWKHHRAVRCYEVCLVHGVLHHRGPGLLQHRWPHRTLEWQKLQWHWQHLKTRESLCLMPLNMAVYIYKLLVTATAVTWLTWTFLPINHRSYFLKGGEKVFLLEFTLKNILLPSFNVQWTNTSIICHVFVLHSILVCSTAVCSGIKCKYSALICNALLCLIGLSLW